MIKMKYHPLTIVFRLYNLIKGSILIAIFLFVLNGNSDSWFFQYGRYAFIVFILWRMVHIIMSWFFEIYDWEDKAFHLRKGIFVKHASTIPFSRIQNVTRKTSVFHKIFGLTSITFETSMDGADDAIRFEVVSKDQADVLIQLVKGGNRQGQASAELVGETIEDEASLSEDRDERDVTVHFTSEKKDLIKASFTSLSFLAIIPLIFAALENLEPFLPDLDEVEGIFQTVTSSYLLLSLILVLALVVAVAFGVVRTFTRYGNYQISSDAKHIYIKRGMLSESDFSIEKSKIQGLEMVQPVLKRLFGLVEVKIISSASPGGEEDSTSVNSLYPFLPMKKAYELIEELMPDYKCDIELRRLPKISLWVKLMKPSWLWIFATIGLVYFKPDLFQIERAWIFLIVALFFLVVILRVLDYMHTRYAIQGDQVQWWHGGLTARMFMTKRSKIIEMSYSQTRLQRIFQLASITTLNRSTPPRIEVIKDVPYRFAVDFQEWYFGRGEEQEVLD